MTNAERLLTVQQAAEFLGLKPKTLYSLKAQRRIPYVKILGNALRFRLTDLQKIVDDCTIPAREVQQ